MRNEPRGDVHDVSDQHPFGRCAPKLRLTVVGTLWARPWCAHVPLARTGAQVLPDDGASITWGRSRHRLGWSVSCRTWKRDLLFSFFQEETAGPSSYRDKEEKVRRVPHTHASAVIKYRRKEGSREPSLANFTGKTRGSRTRVWQGAKFTPESGRKNQILRSSDSVTSSYEAQGVPRRLQLWLQSLLSGEIVICWFHTEEFCRISISRGCMFNTAKDILVNDLFPFIYLLLSSTSHSLVLSISLLHFCFVRNTLEIVWSLVLPLFM